MNFVETRRAGAPDRDIAARWEVHALSIVLIALFFLQAVVSMRQMSMVADEDVDIAAGYSYWTTRDGRMNYEHPPLIKMLATFPLLFLRLKTTTDDPSWSQIDQTRFSQVFLHQDPGRFEQILMLSRTSIVLLAVVLGFFVWKWARELWGPEAGLAAVFLFALEPNTLAYSRLVTMDLGVTLFSFVSIYYLWRWLRTGSRLYALLTSLMVGLSLLSKYSALVLLPICVAEFAVYRYVSRPPGGAPRGVTAWGFLRILIGSALVVILMYALAFRWHPVLHSGGGHQTLPRLLAHVPVANHPDVQRTLVSLGERTPLPPVHWYLTGLLAQGEKLARGYPGFLNGHYSSHGWWYFYLAAFIMKTPIPILLLVIIRLVSVRDRMAVTDWSLAKTKPASGRKKRMGA